MFRVAQGRYASDVLRAQTTDSVLDACINHVRASRAVPVALYFLPVDAVIGLVISAVMIASGLKLAVSEFVRLTGGADLKRENGIKKLALSLKRRDGRARESV